MNSDLPNISKKTMEKLLMDQQDEITAHHLYKKIADYVKDENNAKIIREVSEDELEHYNRLKSITKKELKPEKIKIFFFYWLTVILGITFGIKLLERGEKQAIENYENIHDDLRFMDDIIEDEERHEDELISMINEERLNYIGSIVLGLNDALVELTGALAGYTFAFQNSRLIALTGLITGISATFSMAASEYLATRQEGGENPIKSSIYTGVAYIFTVILLVLPFLFITNYFVSLSVTLGVAVFIIFIFNYYISVSKDYVFIKRFIEMASISLGVAAISFIIGVLVKQFVGIEI
jgi:VIT1/CCC1 family predicted Fe2+/Mn2+ transporter